MTKDESIAKLIQCQNNDDIEDCHSDADDILCELLISLGYKEVVEEYEKVEKWFA